MLTLLRRRGIVDERVLAAMGEIPRERFVPPELADEAYADRALPIGGGQTISQPWIVAFMVSCLRLSGEERTLEVGTGSGYGAAVLARCCGAVVSIERRPELAEGARAALADAGIMNVEVRVGDGARGAPDRAPFEGMLVTAMASAPPPALLAQLGPHAPLVCPLGEGGSGYLVRIRGPRGGPELLVPAGFVPLVEDPEPPTT